MKDHFCHCGTVKEAYETGLKLVEDAYRHDCPVWAVQVACAMQQIAFTLLRASSGMDATEFKQSMQQFQHDFGKSGATPEITDLISKRLAKAMDEKENVNA